MARSIPWTTTLTAKLGAIALTLLALSLVLVLGNLYALASISGDAAWMNLAGGNRALLALMLHRVNRLADAPDDAKRLPLQDDLRTMIAELDRRTDLLLRGDPATGTPAPTDPRLLENLNDRLRRWNQEIKPLVLGSSSGGAPRPADLDRLESLIAHQIEQVTQGNDYARDMQTGRIARARLGQFLYTGVVVLVIGAVLAIARGLGRRARSLAHSAERIAGGDLAHQADVAGSDELAAMAEAFNAMTANLRATIETETKARARIERLLESIRTTSSRLSSTAAEILATTAQQAAGAQEQAAAVAQTVTSVDQVAQTATQAAQRAKGVGETVQRTLEIGQAGRRTVDESIAAMNHLKGQVEATAQTILTLAAQAQAIGEIIATVNDIAEQTNLLALNAAIEASRAGEHGRGFAVVAEEVKALADQSKKATKQVRQILGEVQKATNTAVFSTEEVTKGVAAAIGAGGQSNQTIHALSEALSDSARAAAQIVASAGQQATGMAQISQAMRNLDEVARQNLAATRQVEQAAQDLNALGALLTGLVGT
ncbi:MAG TPA: methyl-accepting chemotaxis protein [Isosphaeraceae bacterium]|jgi:methyl-accepting chemotaxis protein